MVCSHSFRQWLSTFEVPCSRCANLQGGGVARSNSQSSACPRSRTGTGNCNLRNRSSRNWRWNWNSRSRFQEPEPKQSRSDQLTLLKHRNNPPLGKSPEPKTRTTRTAPPPNLNRTKPNCGHPEFCCFQPITSLFVALKESNRPMAWPTMARVHAPGVVVVVLSEGHRGRSSERLKHALNWGPPFPITFFAPNFPVGGKTVNSYRRSCRNSRTSHRKGGILERGRGVMERGGTVLRTSQRFSALSWPFRIRNLILKISETSKNSLKTSQTFLGRCPSLRCPSTFLRGFSGSLKGANSAQGKWGLRGAPK